MFRCRRYFSPEVFFKPQVDFDELCNQSMSELDVSKNSDESTSSRDQGTSKQGTWQQSAAESSLLMKFIKITSF